MLKSIKDIFRTDEFVASSEVFPNIDKDRIVKDLKLEDEGKSRGKTNQPETKASTLDHIELKAVSRVEELRRRGLENFETNRRVYAERLNLAVSARMQVETEANDAKSRFVEEVTKWKSMMVTPRERVTETYAWRKQFRSDNKLMRPARLGPVWPGIIALSFFMVLMESVGNAYLFSQSNPLGILGGLIAAFLVSAGNVLVSTLLGILSRYINCRGFQNVFKKLFGLLFGLMWFGFMVVYNLGVAHFRDGAERIDEWREAGTQAIQTLLANPIGLSTMESYILLLLGVFISVISFIKGHNAGDPYPRYAKVSQDVVDARNDYVAHLQDSIEDLAEHRDQAVESLRDANDEVHRNINDSVDALYGQKALTSNLAPFLEQCNLSANYALAVYRDANKTARKEEPPKYFKQKFAFEPFVTPEFDESKRQEAEKQVKEVSEMVNKAIRDIFNVFDTSVLSHYEIDELEGTVIERLPTSSRPTGAIDAKTGLTVVKDDKGSA